MVARAIIFLLLAALLVPGLGLFAFGAGSAVAAEGAQTASSSLVPLPPKGKGDNCVADTDFMRRYHMTVLDHQRDDTVHDGIRTKQFSLKECVECHAVNGPDAKPVTVENPKHFCRTCHDYAAVKIDCFECHASRPEAKKSAGLPTEHHGRDLRAALTDYLEGKAR